VETHTQTKTPAKLWQGLMAAKEITQAVNISRAHLHALTKEHKFPPPALRIGTRFTRWRGEDVFEWMRDPSAWIAANTKSPTSTKN
jgi:predicted DNA-binding transcriptional regulator AlpA